MAVDYVQMLKDIERSYLDSGKPFTATDRARELARLRDMRYAKLAQQGATPTSPDGTPVIQDSVVAPKATAINPEERTVVDQLNDYITEVSTVVDRVNNPQPVDPYTGVAAGPVPDIDPNQLLDKIKVGVAEVLGQSPDEVWKDAPATTYTDHQQRKEAEEGGKETDRLQPPPVVQEPPPPQQPQYTPPPVVQEEPPVIDEHQQRKEAEEGGKEQDYINDTTNEDIGESVDQWNDLSDIGKIIGPMPGDPDYKGLPPEWGTESDYYRQRKEQEESGKDVDYSERVPDDLYNKIPNGNPDQLPVPAQSPVPDDGYNGKYRQQIPDEVPSTVPETVPETPHAETSTPKTYTDDEIARMFGEEPDKFWQSETDTTGYRQRKEQEESGKDTDHNYHRQRKEQEEGGKDTDAAARDYFIQLISEYQKRKEAEEGGKAQDGINDTPPPQNEKSVIDPEIGRPIPPGSVYKRIETPKEESTYPLFGEPYKTSYLNKPSAMIGQTYAPNMGQSLIDSLVAQRRREDVLNAPKYDYQNLLNYLNTARTDSGIALKNAMFTADKDLAYKQTALKEKLGAIQLSDMSQNLRDDYWGTIFGGIASGAANWWGGKQQQNWYNDMMGVYGGNK